MVDLHIHTICSDGRETPEVVVYRANQLGLKAIAITDHDTVDGCVRAIAAAPEGTTVLSGIELSAAEGVSAVHILGYGIDPFDASLSLLLDSMKRDRYDRAGEIVNRLQAMDLPLTLETVESVAGGSPITRAHVAEALRREQMVSTYTEAFDRYLSDSQPAFVLQESLTVAEAIAAIHSAGGVAFMAHPGVTRRDEVIPSMVEAGLDGIEVFHPSHEAASERFYTNLAAKHRLLVSGGSDYHGSFRGTDRMGLPYVPLTVFDAVIAAISRRTLGGLSPLGSETTKTRPATEDPKRTAARADASDSFPV